MLWVVPPHFYGPAACLCFYAVFVLGTFLFLVWQTVKMMLRYESSRTDIPPGGLGLPLIGETLQFMAAINSSHGFYEFVRLRRLRSPKSLCIQVLTSNPLYVSPVWVTSNHHSKARIFFTYGNCFKTNIFRETHVFVSSTEWAKAILNNESGKFTKRYIKSIAELVGDDSLLCASHHHHKLIRTRLLNLFSTTSISRFVNHFDALIVTSLCNLENQGTVIVLHHALKITFKAMCKMLMGMEGGPELESLQEDIACLYEAMLAFPLRFPWSRFSKGLQARKRIMETLEMMITERRRCPEAANREDFLQRLLTEADKSCSDEAYRLSDAEIKDNILTMIIAGQDTTASAITWMVKYLGEHQDVLDLLRAEQFQLAERTSNKSFLSLEDLNDMPYASKVVKESLRMASIVPWFPRLALQDCEFEGYRIMKGWNVNIDARSIHLDPIMYNDPNKFNPSRFDDESKPCSFLAFGMGGRTCLGMNMAKAMMLVFLHRLITTYKWKVIDSDSSIEKWALFSRLKSGCPVKLTRISKVLIGHGA